MQESKNITSQENKGELSDDMLDNISGGRTYEPADEKQENLSRRAGMAGSHYTCMKYCQLCNNYTQTENYGDVFFCYSCRKYWAYEEVQVTRYQP